MSEVIAFENRLRFLWAFQRAPESLA